MRMVRPYVKRMVGLTGTPTPQGLEDLFAEVGIIDNFQRFGRFIGRFRDAYFRKGAYNPYTGVVFNYIPLPDAEKRIYDKISDIAISMKSVDYLDMPECIYVDHEVDMDPDERAVYDEMKKELVVELDGETVTSQNAAVLSNKSNEQHSVKSRGAERQQHTHGFCNEEHEKLEQARYQNRYHKALKKQKSIEEILAEMER